MSLRQVLTIYNAERQLNEDDIALLNTLRKLNDNDRELLVQGLSDKPQKKSTERVIEHCAACDYTRRAKVHKDATVSGYHEFQPSKKSAGKSKHASSLQQQIQTARPTLDGGVSKMRCSREGCGEYADHNKHHLTTDPDYHEFQPAATSAAGAGD